MRILHLLKTSVGGGWAIDLAAALGARGIEGHVALPAGGPQVARARAAGLVVHETPLDLAPWAWRGGADLRRALRRLVADVAPDVIHAHFVHTALAARLALGRRHPVPRLFQVPGPLHLEHPVTRRLELATAGPRDRWVGASRYTCRRYRGAGVAAARVAFCPYPAVPGRYADLPAGALRTALGAPPGAALVAMVAFMYPPRPALGRRVGVKGHEDFIAAVARGRGTRTERVAACVGGAWAGAAAYEARLRASGAARCGPGLRFLGTRADALALLRGADVAVVPSRSDNYGGAAEAALLGIPIVATAVGGIPELVEDGVTGWLVPPGDPVRLAAAIDAALADPAEARIRAAAAQARARHLFDPDAVAARMRGIYASAVRA